MINGRPSRQNAECLRDRRDAQPCTRARQPLDLFIEALAHLGWRERLAPWRGPELVRWQPCRTGPPPEALIGCVPVGGLLLRSRISERSEAPYEPGIRRRLRMFANRGLPPALREFELLLGALDTHSGTTR